MGILTDNIPTCLLFDEAVRESVREALAEAQGKTAASEVAEAVTPLRGEAGVPPPDDPVGLLKMHREWVYACVVRNAQGVAQVPLRLYVARPRRASRSLLWDTRPVAKVKRMELEERVALQRYLGKAGDLEEVVDHGHPFYRLWEDGNPHLTGTQLKMLLVMHMELVGDSYAFIVMGEGGRGVPQHLQMLSPGSVIKIHVQGGKISAYTIRQAGGLGTLTIPGEEIMHNKYPDPADPVWGKSPLEAVGYAASLYHSMTLYEYYLMENGATPGWLATAAEGLTEPDKRRLERKFRQQYGGVKKAGGIAVVSTPLKLEKLALSQREMLMPLGREMTRQDICVAFDVPMAILLSEKVNLANVKMGEYLHQKKAIRPRCLLIEDQINRDIIPFYGDENLFVAFDNPVREDEDFALKRRDSDLDRFVVTVNEVREQRGDDPVPWGNTPFVPMTTIPLSMTPARGGATAARRFHKPQVAGSIPAPATKQLPFPYEVERLSAELAEVVVRMFGDRAQEILANIAGSPVVHAGAAEAWLFVRRNWDEVWLGRARPVLAGLIVQGGELGNQAAGIAAAFDVAVPQIAQAVEEYTVRLSPRIWGSVSAETERRLRTQFAEAIQNGETIRDVRERVRETLDPEATRPHAERVARTETSRFVHEGQELAWRQSGAFEAKEWLCSADACDFCLPLDGKRVGLGESYYEQGTVLTSEGESAAGELVQHTMVLDYEDVGHPPLHPHCHCSMVPIPIGQGG